MASAMDNWPAAARLAAVAAAGQLTTATNGRQSSYTTCGDTTKRTPEDAWQHLGQLIDTIQPNECQNYIQNTGYGSN